jgi:hypothetical protein
MRYSSSIKMGLRETDINDGWCMEPAQNSVLCQALILVVDLLNSVS